MNTLISKSWQYSLHEENEKLFLSVVCGTVAVFTLNIELSEIEKQLFLEKGERYVDELAAEITYNHEGFMSRNIPERE
jgi:hypothetical protein